MNRRMAACGCQVGCVIHHARAASLRIALIDAVPADSYSEPANFFVFSQWITRG